MQYPTTRAELALKLAKDLIADEHPHEVIVGLNDIAEATIWEAGFGREFNRIVSRARSFISRDTLPARIPYEGPHIHFIRD